VLGVAAVAAVVSYEHASALIQAQGESGWTGWLIPLTVDGMIYATLAANVAHGLGQGNVGAAVAAWPAVALVGSYELLVVIIRGAQTQTAALRPHGGASMIDPFGDQAAVVFAAELAADHVPSVRAISAALHVGQLRAQRLRDYLAAAAYTHGRSLAA
jgi:hypothetical protein